VFTIKFFESLWMKGAPQYFQLLEVKTVPNAALLFGFILKFNNFIYVAGVILDCLGFLLKEIIICN
jgi:hypothetical protein